MDESCDPQLTWQGGDAGMTGDFWSFEHDRERRFLRITLRGFWTVEVMDAYEPLLAQQMKAAKAVGGETFILVDARAHQVQSRAIAERQQTQLASLKPYYATRCALLVPGAVFRMQAARIAAPVDHRVFDDEAAALAWLFPDGR